MALLTLGQAARLTGVNKTTLARAIKAGRLSATRRDDGGYLVDPAELERVYPIRHEADAAVAATGRLPQHAAPSRDLNAAARIAALEGEVKAHAAEVRLLRELADNLRGERDAWKDQAARLAIAPPSRRAWWPWRRST